MHFKKLGFRRGSGLSMLSKTQFLPDRDFFQKKKPTHARVFAAGPPQKKTKREVFRSLLSKDHFASTAPRARPSTPSTTGRRQKRLPKSGSSGCRGAKRVNIGPRSF
jgi:hypothetical protein